MSWRSWSSRLLISIARIVKTRGIRGEVAAELLTEFPWRFEEIDRVFVAVDDTIFEERLENFWFHKARIILKFAGRDRPHEVDELVGGEVRIPEEERVELPADTYFDADLVGCSVFEGDQKLGEVVSIFRGGDMMANLVVSTDEDEIMIPFVKEFTRRIDLESKRIDVELPPGLTQL